MRESACEADICFFFIKYAITMAVDLKYIEKKLTTLQYKMNIKDLAVPWWHAVILGDSNDTPQPKYVQISGQVPLLLDIKRYY